MNIKYITKNVFSMNSYINYHNQFNLENETKYSIDDLLDYNKYSISKDGLLLKIIYSNCINDGYDIEIKKDKVIIEVKNYRSLRYAFKTFNNLIEKNKLPIIKISDNASFNYRGIIEGYYGEPWTFDERKDMIDFMDENRLNCYMYAPKSDVYHRSKWYELYPEKEFNELMNLKNGLESKGMDFFYCISPGHAPKGEKGFVYSTENDFIRLFKKLDQVINNGVTKFGLLLDDIDYTLTGENLEKFKRPGIAHSYICNRVYEYLNTHVSNLEMVMCPTEYSKIGPSVYRTDLKEQLNKNIKVFWTGYNVCAEVITKEHCYKTKEAFGHDLYIWDNFPVSDFTYGVRQFMAPIRNRCVELNEYADSYIINPMNEYYISKIGMQTMADYAWNTYRYNPEISFDNALKSVGDDFYKYCHDYIEFNYLNVLSYGNEYKQRQMVMSNDINGIKDFYKKARISANKLLKLDLPIICELKPWLERVKKEEKIVNSVLDNNYNVKDIIKFLKNIKFSGCKILDMLLVNILNDETYTTLIKKRRGNKWYRVWEDNR